MPVHMDGPVLVFGGPYSNLEATQAVLNEAQRRAIPPERIICTGDIVAYAADAQATLAAVRDAGIWAIMGNCEESLGSSAEDCGCGYSAGSACDLMAVEWYRHADRMLDRDARAWMARLPRHLEIEIAGRRLVVVHGGVRQINRFFFASTPEPALRSELDAAQCDGVVAGHCGIPFTSIVDGRLWHNSGAIGMPANDGTARTWFSVLTPSGDGIAIEHCALRYDHAAAAAKMRACGLPEGYAAALGSGLWPSRDVLPDIEFGRTGAALNETRLLWRRDDATRSRPKPAARPAAAALAAEKFRDPDRTAAGETRAAVTLRALKTLWFNTGTLCNIACHHCYIESSPKNDRLSYLTLAEMRGFLDEIARDGLPTEELGFTGGEPFMNPDMLAMLEEGLSRGFRVIVLTNAMRPMLRLRAPLLDLQRRLGAKLTLRVSLDHYTRELHEEERGADTWQPTIDGITWLAANGFTIAVAGRMLSGESDAAIRQGYAQLFADHGIALDALDRDSLTLFPEMDAAADVPEIAADSWGQWPVSPDALMCASARMVVKRRESRRPSVVACTLLPYDEAFDLGATLSEASRAVKLNHPHCAKFCVLGAGSCGGS